MPLRDKYGTRTYGDVLLVIFVRYPDVETSQELILTGFELILKRIIAGLTQSDIARELGVHPARISEMERGRREIMPNTREALDRILAECTRK